MILFSYFAFIFLKIWIFLIHIFCSESDVALIIKYCYHDQCAEEEKASSIYYKDPKCKDKKKTDVILDNKIKLPALMFGQYLDQDCQGFIDDCIRLAKKIELCFCLIHHKKLPLWHDFLTCFLASWLILPNCRPLHNATTIIRNSPFIKSNFCNRY